MIVLLFDANSMQPPEVARAVASAKTWVRERLTPADLVAVAAVGQSLRVVSDFTPDYEVLMRALGEIDATAAAGFEQPAADDGVSLALDSAESPSFNSDRRLRALRTLAGALAPFERRKAILYFSSGLTRSDMDNQMELRGAINAANRANVSIYPVDGRGLSAIVPANEAAETRSSETDHDPSTAFSGGALLGQLGALSASQETLATLAVGTGAVSSRIATTLARHSPARRPILRRVASPSRGSRST